MSNRSGLRASASSSSLQPALTNGGQQHYKKMAEQLREQYVRAHEESSGRINERIGSLAAQTAAPSASRGRSNSGGGGARFSIYTRDDENAEL